MVLPKLLRSAIPVEGAAACVADGDDHDDVLPDHVSDVVPLETGHVLSADSMFAESAGLRVSPDVRNGEPQAEFEVVGNLGIVGGEKDEGRTSFLSGGLVKSDGHGL